MVFNIQFIKMDSRIKRDTKKIIRQKVESLDSCIQTNTRLSKNLRRTFCRFQDNGCEGFLENKAKDENKSRDKNVEF